MQGYVGMVATVLIPINGKSIGLNGITIHKVEEGVEIGFLRIDAVTININRKALFAGKIFVDLVLDSPSFIFSNYDVEKGEKVGLFKPFTIDLPVTVSQVMVTNAQLEYTDTTLLGNLKMQLCQLNILASNISNIYQAENQLPTVISVEAYILGGSLKATIQADLFKPFATFDLNAQVKDIDLVRLNSLFMQHANFDVSKGKLSVFTEIATKENQFVGYVKPEIFNLEILGPEDKSNKILNRIWQNILAFVVTVLENKKSNLLATKIPVSGTFKEPHANILYAFIGNDCCGGDQKSDN